jgi:hypothetical protein
MMLLTAGARCSLSLSDIGYAKHLPSRSQSVPSNSFGGRWERLGKRFASLSPAD